MEKKGGSEMEIEISDMTVPEVADFAMAVCRAFPFARDFVISRTGGVIKLKFAVD